MARWKPPRIGTKARNAMPRSAFLKPSVKKYPYKKKVGNRWVADKRGTQSALQRASQHGEATVAQKARNVQKRHGW